MRVKSTIEPSNRENILAARQLLQPVKTNGWLSGFSNMVDKEFGEWFRTRRWIVQFILWLLIINGLIGLIVFVLPGVDPQGAQDSGAPTGPEGIFMIGMTLFFSLAAQIGSIGAIILTQDEVIQEKQSGTAAWILSKPVSRYAFILSKLLASGVGVMIFIVILPAIAAYFQIFLASTRAPSLPAYLLGMGIVLIDLFFYISLVILSGVIFSQRGPVLGIAFGMMFLPQIFTGFLPEIAYILPVNLQNIAVAVAMQQPVPMVGIIEIAATAAWCLVFILAALLRFNQEEF